MFFKVNKRSQSIIYKNMCNFALLKGYSLENPMPLLVAVSGGIDSMVLLHLLLRANFFNVQVAHFNHGDRGNNDNRDADFVKEYCLNHNLRFHLGHGDVGRILAADSLEHECRVQRYQFLSTVRKAFGIHYVSVGHTADDQLENIYMALGKGFVDLNRAVMKEDNMTYSIYRPLLILSREYVTIYAKKYDIPYVIDETNEDTRRLRNYYRHEVIPAIKAKTDGLKGLMKASSLLIK